MLFVLVLLLIQTVLFLLKVVGVIHWDWDTVFIPIYIFTVLVMIALAVVALVWLLCGMSFALLMFLI